MATLSSLRRSLCRIDSYSLPYHLRSAIDRRCSIAVHYNQLACSTRKMSHVVARMPESSSGITLSSEAASISDPPAAGQTVVHDNSTYTTVQEGLAYILIPPSAPLLTDPKKQLEGNAPSQSVFYNPIQQFNRDLTVLAIRAFGEDYVAAKRAKPKYARENKSRKKQKRGSSTNGSEHAGLENTASKRRKVENSGLEPVTETPNDGNNTTQKLPVSFEDLEDDDLNDEDFLACESSALQGGSVKAKEVALETIEEKKERLVDFKILDALSATGLRALRYAHELDFVTSVTANDLSSKAVDSIKLNIRHNSLEEKVKTTTGNANAHMYSLVGQEGKGGSPKYEVVDLDPYGTAVPFLDAAVQATSDGGLLCVTCTDSGVFNSVGYLEKTFSQYGGLPIKGEHLHEGGLRLILHAITTSAAKYGIDIEPLLSLSIDYYARVFVRVRKSPADVKFLASKTAIVYGCDHGCGAWQLQFLARATEQQGKKRENTFYKHHLAQGPSSSPTCEHCCSKTHVSLTHSFMKPLANLIDFWAHVHRASSQSRFHRAHVGFVAVARL